MAVTVRIEDLGPALRQRRLERNLSLRDVEDSISVSAATLSRIERGHSPDNEVIAKLAEWLGLNVTAAGESASAVRTDEDLKNQIAVHLRANKHLPEDVAKAIVQGFEAIMIHEVNKAKQAAKPIDGDPQESR
jgi:transcriptional regulator with XRE-family HTH domain